MDIQNDVWKKSALSNLWGTEQIEWERAYFIMIFEFASSLKSTLNKYTHIHIAKKKSNQDYRIKKSLGTQMGEYDNSFDS